MGEGVRRLRGTGCEGKPSLLLFTSEGKPSRIDREGLPASSRLILAYYVATNP